MFRASHILGEAGASFINLDAEADTLPHAQSSHMLERFGGSNFKVLRTDGIPYSNEVHGYTEGLLVIDGQPCLRIGDEMIAVSRSELYVVPAGVPHSVGAGSVGTLVILDAQAECRLPPQVA